MNNPSNGKNKLTSKKLISEEHIIKEPSKVAKIIINSKDKEHIVKEIWNILEKTENKKLIKSIKRVLYILKSNKIDVDKLKPEKTGIGAKTTENTEFSKNIENTLLFLPDSFANSRIAFILYDVTTASFEVVDIIYNFEKGIRTVQDQKINKKTVNRLLLEKEAIKVPIPFALYRIKDIAIRTDTASKLPDSIRASVEKATPVRHPVYSRNLQGILRVLPPENSEEVKKLFLRQEVARLSIPDEYTAEYKRLIEEAAKSVLIIGNKTPQERINDLIQRFISTYFTPARIYSYKELLLDISFYFLSQGNKGASDIMLGYAEKISQPGPDIQKHPLIQLLIYKSFLAKQ